MATLLAVVQEDPAPTERAGPLTAVLQGLLTRDAAQRWDVARARAGLREVLAGAGPGPAWTPPEPRGPAPTGGPELGGQVERFDVDDLRALASVIGTVARDARDQARYLAEKRRERKERREHGQRERRGERRERRQHPGRRADRQPRAAAAPPAAAPPAAAPAAAAPPAAAPPAAPPRAAPPQAAAPRVTAPPAAPPAGGRRPSAPARRLRFKRRWVVVPVLIAVLAVLAAVGGLVALLAAALGVW
jgi:pyruvate/2-oxoglutarate dehydrogenase complex dihydrolipoamide acyltransferase (E2) component